MTPQSITASDRPNRPVFPTTPSHISVDRRRQRRLATRQTILASALVGVVALLILLSFPLIRVLQTSVWIETRGCKVEWNLSPSNWWYGGNSAVIDPRYWGSQMSEQDLLLLKHLPRLLTLSLPEAERITDNDLAALRELPYLTKLDLPRLKRFRYADFDTGIPPLTDACLAHIEPLQKLESLDLSGNKITDAGLARIAKLPALRTLDLAATEITDAGLVHLTNMKSLETLDLGATRVTLAAVTRLQAAQPNLLIILDADPLVEAGVKRMRGEKR
jgi:Leucine Rich repeats (2 copies)